MSAELVSTRDEDEVVVSYADALLAGLAPDRGLYTPKELPKVSGVMLESLRCLTYPELFMIVKGLFIGDEIDPVVQKDLAKAAFTEEKFPGVKDGNFMPVVQLQDGFFLQNLSLGPTAAFKDAALQPLAQDLNYILSKRNDRLRLLGATSGDTGSAAGAGVKGLGRLSLLMLSPLNGMSPFQRAQMGQLSGGNIHNISVRGGKFDDCQDMVKETKADPEFADLGAVNSINWGRIASQIPYYFSGYLQVVGEKIGDPVDFVVPTGNFGNILAAYFAREMGLPIRRLIVATNENNVLHRLIQTGEYKKQTAKDTSSPSMDISKSSNYERLVYYLMGGDPRATAEYMETFESKGSVAFNEFDLPSDVLKRLGFDSGTSTHADRLDTIRWVYKESGVIVDPHTADAIKVARTFAEKDVPIVSMATALPVKFEQTIQEALGFVPEREDRFKGLEDSVDVDDAFKVIEPDVDALKEYIREHSI